MNINIKILFIFSFSFVVLSFGQNQEWDYVSKDENGNVFYLDKNYTKAKKDFPEVLVKKIDNEFYSIISIKLDCSKKKTILLSESKYEKDGTLIWKTVSSKNWVNIESLSVNEIIFNKVCAVSDIDNFVKKSYISLINRKDLFAEILVTKTNIFSLPSDESDTINEVKFGDRLKIIGKFKDEPWYEVIDRKTGNKGWIHFNTFSIVTARTPPPPIEISFALKSSITTVEKNFTLEINGNNIPPNSIITFNGVSLPTIYVSPNSIKANVPNKLYAVEGKAFVKVITPKRIIKKHALIIVNIKNPSDAPYSYVGLIKRLHAMNNTAYLIKTGGTDPFGVRLNDIVGGRYRVVSISDKEVILKDKELGLEYRLPLTKVIIKDSTQPSKQNTQSCPPGIPCNVQPYRPIQPTNTNDEEDEDEDGDN